MARIRGKITIPAAYISTLLMPEPVLLVMVSLMIEMSINYRGTHTVNCNDFG